MGDYTTVFDFATRLPFGWQAWVMIATIIGFAVAVPLRFRRAGRTRWAFITFLGIAAVVGALISSAVVQYVEVARAVINGRVQVAEGTVSNFAGAQRGQPVEAFQLGGQQFSYDYGLLKPGYNATQLWGGHLRDGEHVRVTYYDSSWNERVITKVEVARGA
ncbi:MAG: hypothetical protein GC190_04000 [Alphaproteobacteria bacterium]|nr:hypothetical protein [Alphaproteobacteria bacterium]